MRFQLLYYSSNSFFFQIIEIERSLATQMMMLTKRLSSSSSYTDEHNRERYSKRFCSGDTPSASIISENMKEHEHQQKSKNRRLSNFIPVKIEPTATTTATKQGSFPFNNGVVPTTSWTLTNGINSSDIDDKKSSSTLLTTGLTTKSKQYLLTKKHLELRRLQKELQCHEAMLTLMQKLKINQKLVNNEHIHLQQRTTNNNTVSSSSNIQHLKRPITNNSNTSSNSINKQSTLQQKQPLSSSEASTTKLNNEQLSSKQLGASKIPQQQQQQQQQLHNRPSMQPSSKPSHPNQYTVNRSNHQQKSSSMPQQATRISSTIPSQMSNNTSQAFSRNSLTSNQKSSTSAEQHLLNAKLALRKQLEQTLLQIPTPKPSTSDLSFIPGVNGWSEFLAIIGAEQALQTYNDSLFRRPLLQQSSPGDSSTIPTTKTFMPFVCSQCNTDWSVTWHTDERNQTDENATNNNVLCDRCMKTNQKKLLKQDHSNRLRQAFIKALQQEKDLEAKFQNTVNIPQSSSSSPVSHTSTTPSTAQPSNHKHSNHLSKTSAKQQQHSTKMNQNHNFSSTKSNTTPPLSQLKTSSSSNLRNNTSSPPTNSLSQATKLLSSTVSGTTTAAAALAAALNTTNVSAEQLKMFQKHFLSNMLPFAGGTISPSTLAQIPGLASMRQNPALTNYLLDM
ncbi:unnamed protein product [Didymodactylos carnosus]|uniref:Uncharacterized protein n=1 Tax=Didymodactylos carnosus TaxID=1234261 RepID=A0A813SQJ7_9BILA|nr:unnamed protein product [Didymodactylos carnosus]CAF0800347.1 unnamed protein product [Didymodactylos carnosus]CAF3507587.1 unnamed protein product [Didymodactylos carnosus]CAF3585311.1 unnamed protein product [Didymodactylos carnosus]